MLPLTPPCLLCRLSFSDSESDNSADSCLPGREPLPPQKPPPPGSKVSRVQLSAGFGGYPGRAEKNMLQLTGPGSPQVSGRRSPEPCSKPEKILKKATYDKVRVSGPEGWAGGALSCTPLGCPSPLTCFSPGLHG